MSSKLICVFLLVLLGEFMCECEFMEMRGANLMASQSGENILATSEENFMAIEQKLNDLERLMRSCCIEYIHTKGKSSSPDNRNKRPSLSWSRLKDGNFN